MDYRQLVQTHYFQEFERKRELNGNLSIVVGVLTIIAAGLATMLKAIQPPFGRIEALLSIALAATALVIGVAIYYAVRAFVGHAYRYVAPMMSVTKWRTEAQTRGFQGVELDNATVAIFVDQYVEAVATNDAVNDTKSGYVHRSSQAAVAALVLVLVSAVPWAALEVLRASSNLSNHQVSQIDDTGQRQRQAAGAGKGTAACATESTDQGKRNSSRAKGSRLTDQPSLPDQGMRSCAPPKPAR